jgi:2-C-methyl-D-erythritol 4-phosphate cytidylyltransferase
LALTRIKTFNGLRFHSRYQMISPRHFALIPAAGVGARMGVDHPKQYLPLAGKAMLLHALETFALHPVIEHSFVVVSAEDGYIDDLLAAQAHLQDKVTVLRHGGQTRHASVLNGLRVIANQLTDSDWVLVHDAARPGLTKELIDRLVHALKEDAVGGLLALPVVDTLKRSDAQSCVQETVSRENLWAAQTPQMFRYGLLKHALESTITVTDEASAIEALGHHPKLVEGSPRNFKVTLPHDVALAELHLKGNS